MKPLHAKIKPFNFITLMPDPKARLYLCSLTFAASLVSCVYFIGKTFPSKDYRTFPGLMNGTQHNAQADKCQVSGGLEKEVNYAREKRNSDKCMEKCRPPGSEALPEGIVTRTSNLEMRPLWGPIGEKTKAKHSVSLLAVPVGINQKELVNQMIEKFLEHDFVVMLFHYDGIVDEWNDLDWSGHVIHISAINQTKWWFAKRFLHPDIVSEYDYIFLWDEDLGVENFHPGRKIDAIQCQVLLNSLYLDRILKHVFYHESIPGYLSIVKEEDLEISQPALDGAKSEVHHQITTRRRKSRVHRRFYKLKGGGRCYNNSKAPPCVGWVEMMAPVFSRAAWRCAWYMIQNDLIHAWGLDMQLGYCAQGDRTRKVGVVDSEYIIHSGLPTLGGVSGVHKLTDESPDSSSQTENSAESDTLATSALNQFDNRSAVRKQSYAEMKIFKKRWRDAVKADQCWVDPYKNSVEQTVH